MNILSIDWDFFFPCVDEFDWGHQETPMFLEMLWGVRCGNRSILTQEKAIHKIVPNLKALLSFWEIIDKHATAILIITDSHKDINHAFKLCAKKSVRVFNFDAHHDIYYSQKKVSECGNWVWKHRNKISEYHLIYPDWREQCKEKIPKDFSPTSISYSFPVVELPKKFEVVFICRSSAWTPTWYDNLWLEFIHHWKDTDCWPGRLTCPFVNRERTPNMQEAREISDRYDEQLAKMTQSANAENE